MSELILVVDRKDACLRMEGGSLGVRHPDRPVEYFPLGLLGLVVILGNPGVELRVLRALAEAGVATVLLPVRGRGEGVWIGGGLGNSIAIRVAQHRASLGQRGLAIARHLVDAKLAAYARLADSLGFEETVQEIERQQGHVAGAGSREQLMGFEGAAASAW